MRSTTRPRIAGLQIRHSLAIELSFERADPGTRESHINERGLTVYLVDAKQKAKRFGGIQFSPTMSLRADLHGRPSGDRNIHQCRILARLLYSEGENAVASGSRFV